MAAVAASAGAKMNPRSFRGQPKGSRGTGDNVEGERVLRLQELLPGVNVPRCVRAEPRLLTIPRAQIVSPARGRSQAMVASPRSILSRSRRRHSVSMPLR